MDPSEQNGEEILFENDKSPKRNTFYNLASGQNRFENMRLEPKAQCNALGDGQNRHTIYEESSNEKKKCFQIRTGRTKQSSAGIFDLFDDEWHHLQQVIYYDCLDSQNECQLHLGKSYKKSKRVVYETPTLKPKEEVVVAPIHDEAKYRQRQEFSEVTCAVNVKHKKKKLWWQKTLHDYKFKSRKKQKASGVPNDVQVKTYNNTYENLSFEPEEDVPKAPCHVDSLSRKHQEIPGAPCLFEVQSRKQQEIPGTQCDAQTKKKKSKDQKICEINDAEINEFIKEEDDPDLEDCDMCPICYEILVEPFITKPCTHTFCKACLYQMTKILIGSTCALCPMCRSAIKHCTFDRVLDYNLKRKYPQTYRLRQKATKAMTRKGRLPSSTTKYNTRGQYNRGQNNARHVIGGHNDWNAFCYRILKKISATCLTLFIIYYFLYYILCIGGIILFYFLYILIRIYWDYVLLSKT